MTDSAYCITIRLAPNVERIIEVVRGKTDEAAMQAVRKRASALVDVLRVTVDKYPPQSTDIEFIDDTKGSE